MKFKTMLIIVAICFAVIPMAIYAGVSNSLVTGNSVENFDKQIVSMAQNQAGNLQTVIDTAKSDISYLANCSVLQNAAKKSGSTPEAKDLVDRFQASNDMVSSIRLVGSDGYIILGKNSGTPMSNFDEYNNYKDNVLYFDSLSDSTSSSASMFIKQPLEKCTLIVSYSVSSSASVLSEFTDNSAFYGDGQVVVDPMMCWSTGTGFNAEISKTYGEEVTGQFSGLSDGTVSNIISFKINGVDTKGAMVRVGGSDGLIAIASCPTGNAGHYSSGALTVVFVVLVLLVAVAIAGAILAAKTITNPLKKIQETIDKIRRGDHEARIGNVSANEYGQMSRAFNNLVDDIVVGEDRYKNISEMSNNIIFEWNFKTNEVQFSNNFNKKFSYRAPSDHFGDSFLLKAKIHPDDSERYQNDLDRLEKGNDFDHNEYRIKNIYGDFIWVLIRTKTLRDKEGKPSKVVGVIVDIDRAKKSEQQLTERASFDALTELYNRETVESQIDNEISLAEVRKSEMAVLFIDVDDFKHFNDNYSHATGDQVLKFVAKSIKETVGDSGFAGRYGGDEFIAMVRNAEVNSPATIAQKIIETLAKGFDSDVGERLTVSCSIGIAVIKDDYDTRVEYLIGKADDAMYSVKKSGKSNYAFI